MHTIEHGHSTKSSAGAQKLHLMQDEIILQIVNDVNNAARLTLIQNAMIK